ncbi:glycosyltransferase [Peribacillus sp. NPDC058075]|uniref:glycosyltransferase n=1 Tax=unclassified Peribacillus TaxID=2675266 RepID=UPI0036DC5AA8
MFSIITCTMREDFIQNVFNNYNQQTWKDKELIIVLNSDTMDFDKWKEKSLQYDHVQVYQLSEKATLGDCLNFGVLKSKYEYIAKFDDDDYYGPLYLTSASEELKKGDIHVLGKNSYYIFLKKKESLILVSGVENDESDTVAGATLIIKKELFEKIQFEKMNRAEDYFFIMECKKQGYKIFSSNKHHFAVIRHEAENHTWKVADDDLIQWADLVEYSDDYRSIVNNGQGGKSKMTILQREKEKTIKPSIKRNKLEKNSQRVERLSNPSKNQQDVTDKNHSNKKRNQTRLKKVLELLQNQLYKSVQKSELK